jgi:hypothetical protein
MKPLGSKCLGIHADSISDMLHAIARQQLREAHGGAEN